MKRFGAQQPVSHKMDDTRIFLNRLHLLIVMVKAKLKGYPTGEVRKEAVLDNASRVYKGISDLDLSFLESPSSFHLFKERVKLLSVMATAIISEEYPLGIHRREAVVDNIDILIETVFPKQKVRLFHEVLKAA